MSKDKKKVNAWLTQQWAGGYRPGADSEKDPRATGVGSDPESSTKALPPAGTTSKPTGSAIGQRPRHKRIRPRSRAKRKSHGTNFSDGTYRIGSDNVAVKRPQKKHHGRFHKKRGRRHHQHKKYQHHHGEIDLNELPYIETSEFVFIDSMTRSRTKYPHFKGISLYSRYQVMDRHRYRVYTGIEEGKFLKQFLLGPFRPFRINLYGPDGLLALSIERSQNCCLFCVGGHCFGSGAVIKDSDGTALGYVTQRWFRCKPTYDIRNTKKESVLYLQATTRNPFKIIFQRIHFNLYQTADNVCVGMFCKHHWHDVIEGYHPEAVRPVFGAAFPEELDVDMRAPMLAAAFLLHVSYFEHKTGGISGCDIFFYLILLAGACYIVYFYFMDAFGQPYIQWTNRTWSNHFQNLTKSNATNTTVIP